MTVTNINSLLRHVYDALIKAGVRFEVCCSESIAKLVRGELTASLMTCASREDTYHGNFVAVIKFQQWRERCL